MITHETDVALRLLEVSDIEPPHEPAPRVLLRWAREYLCRPHPDLGRRGPVCPYAQTSIDKEQFYISVREDVPASAEALAASLELYRDWFVELAPRGSPRSLFTAILIAFPSLEKDDYHLIDDAQRLLKPAYVQHGLMIGEFHDGPPDKGGLWNPEMRPLRCPVPLLAIRHMVSTDLPFLRDDPDSVAAYLRLFADSVPSHLRGMLAVQR
ncbi:DUF6875 domain-containing protein [Sinosporangium siamense]|uniref:DUF6875 domain-containing protein n=1 Tax=Sinosporangium siamense TaxID=1367973 RepID=A0A919RNS6_9ACTN|nr:hypothetical protein [Sinosporangium siamense]GII96968.1 hypothetical protein Ssi02_71990 [Sinosporangium siamense]